jgi:hypothetical protein
MEPIRQRFIESVKELDVGGLRKCYDRFRSIEAGGYESDVDNMDEADLEEIFNATIRRTPSVAPFPMAQSSPLTELPSSPAKSAVKSVKNTPRRLSPTKEVVVLVPARSGTTPRKLVGPGPWARQSQAVAERQTLYSPKRLRSSPQKPTNCDETESPTKKPAAGRKSQKVQAERTKPPVEPRKGLRLRLANNGAGPSSGNMDAVASSSSAVPSGRKRGLPEETGDAVPAKKAKRARK